MLDIAYKYNFDEINSLITSGNYKYLSFGSYTEFEILEKMNDDYYGTQKVSVDSRGNILGYFSANYSRINRRVDGLMLVKFSHTGNYDDEIADKDFKQFIDEIMNSPHFDLVLFMSVVDNPANKTYELFMEKYNGHRFKIDNYVMLKDGKKYAVYQYVFNRE